MDTITHALSGVLLGRATTSNKKLYGANLSIRARLIAGFLAAAFPDIDIIGRFFGVISYLDMHRGITHSVILLPVWALLLAFIFSRFSKGVYHWKDFYFISLAGIAIHITGDVITAYGTMMFAPFSAAKYAWPSTFIIDIYFTGIILVSILLFWYFKEKGKQVAIGGLVVLLSYIGYQGTLNLQARQVAEKYSQENNLVQADISVMPQPFSPFHWKIIIKTGDKYIVSYIDLISEKVFTAGKDAGLFDRINALYLPVGQNSWNNINQFGDLQPELSKKVWFMDVMKPIRRFMLFPSVNLAVTENKDNCVWFRDHRFVLDGIRHSPFLFGACKIQQKGWSLFRLDNNKMIPMIN